METTKLSSQAKNKLNEAEKLLQSNCIEECFKECAKTERLIMECIKYGLPSDEEFYLTQQLANIKRKLNSAIIIKVRQKK